MHDRDFLQKYMAALTVNHFHKMLYLTGSLMRLSESKLKCFPAKFEDSKIASARAIATTFFTLFTIVTSWHIAKAILNFRKCH